MNQDSKIQKVFNTKSKTLIDFIKEMNYDWQEDLTKSSWKELTDEENCNPVSIFVCETPTKIFIGVHQFPTADEAFNYQLGNQA